MQSSVAHSNLIFPVDSLLFAGFFLTDLVVANYVGGLIAIHLNGRMQWCREAEDYCPLAWLVTDTGANLQTPEKLYPGIA
ncbi:hypothetical protein AB833_03285 [Chromatiales bacterium (ex Bugula neritina AB1)]|nr:hypothetical protein AB833_03285 [Chromatiales bacterium (ex Bugula neritina AB1)]